MSDRKISVHSAVMTERPPIEPYLDEYAIAADYLDEQGVPQYSVVAAALREMRDRVLELFTTDENYPSRDIHTKSVMVQDGWAYATDARILIRVRTSEPNTKHEQQSLTIYAMEPYIEQMDKRRESGEWHTWPTHFEFSGGEPWNATVSAAGRQIALPLAQRIWRLPQVEYLDDRDDYIGIHANEPLQFRFRCGDGFVMPRKVESDE